MAKRQRSNSLFWIVFTLMQVLPLPFRVLFVIVVVAFGAYLQFRGGGAPPQPEHGPPHVNAPLEAPAPRDTEERPAAAKTNTNAEARDPAVIESVTLRDEDGEIVYEGTVDLRPTLERIASGERLSRFSHDGSVFSNREQRLPRKPTGYYHEWVQPTPGERGPGPQRIVTGEAGDVWYSFDHYKTFRRIR
jgi:guanyl-specific ribonuclease Sa